MVIPAITVETLTCYTALSSSGAGNPEGNSFSQPFCLHSMPHTASQHPLLSSHYHPTHLERDKTEDYSRAISGMPLFPISKSQRKKMLISSVKILKAIRNAFQIQDIHELKKRMSTYDLVGFLF